MTWSITRHPLPNTFYVKSQHVDLAANAGVFARDVLSGAGVPHALWPVRSRRWRCTRGGRGRGLVAAAAALGVLGVALSRPLSQA